MPQTSLKIISICAPNSSKCFVFPRGRHCASCETGNAVLDVICMKFMIEGRTMAALHIVSNGITIYEKLMRK
jgi:hypothetical protein